MTYRYFAEHNGQTVRFDHVDYRTPKQAFGYIPSENLWVAVSRKIEFKVNPSLHQCDDRCFHAKGHKCECACGGANHGKGA